MLKTECDRFERRDSRLGSLSFRSFLLTMPPCISARPFSLRSWTYDDPSRFHLELQINCFRKQSKTFHTLSSQQTYNQTCVSIFSGFWPEQDQPVVNEEKWSGR